jgi:hypothetical protein
MTLSTLLKSLVRMVRFFFFSQKHKRAARDALLADDDLNYIACVHPAVPPYDSDYWLVLCSTQGNADEVWKLVCQGLIVVTRMIPFDPNDVNHKKVWVSWKRQWIDGVRDPSDGPVTVPAPLIDPRWFKLMISPLAVRDPEQGDKHAPGADPDGSGIRSPGVGYDPLAAPADIPEDPRQVMVGARPAYDTVLTEKTRMLDVIQMPATAPGAKERRTWMLGAGDFGGGKDTDNA